VVPRLCVNNVSDFIRLADKLYDAFVKVAEIFNKLLKGESPEGYDFKRKMLMVKKAASSPLELLRELLDEQVEAAEEKVEEEGEADPRRLYAPGRLVFLSKPEPVKGQKGPQTYLVTKGSMASPTSQMLLKGSMFSDHSCTKYVYVVVTGEPAPAA
jgi:hypothetical protein